MSYRAYLDREAMEFLLQRRGNDRQLLLRFIASLAEDPFQQGDGFIIDDTGRRHEVIDVRRYRITFWTDHAVKEVKISKIQFSSLPR